VWDVFEPAVDGSTGEVSIDMYHRFADDVALMKQLGIKHYRLSISWSRILPRAVHGSPVNEAGVNYYGRLLSALVLHGITPYVTLFHWDLPAVLEDAYRGPLGGDAFVADFTYYARTLFVLYGPVVKHWITFNEPYNTCVLQYGRGEFAPGVARGKAAQYVCGHTILQAHAAAVSAFRQGRHAGQIGIALDIDWAEPLNTSNPLDVAASQRKLDAKLGWFADPLFLGRYPASLHAHVPQMSAADALAINGSADFLGINQYTARYVAAPAPNDTAAWKELEQDAKGRPIGAASASSWLKDVPWGLGQVLRYVHERYSKPAIMVTENGFSTPGNDTHPLQDDARIAYLAGYTASMCNAMLEHGINVTNYFVWTFTRNWEWRRGFTEDFGIVYVDMTNLQRHVKASGRWLAKHFFSVSP
jgi:beta-glucosidase